jgi:hypothetical protein
MQISDAINAYVDDAGTWIELRRSNGDVLVLRCEDILIADQPAAAPAIRSWCMDQQQRLRQQE